MTFLNPFVLFGLAAAAIPILIHLFNIRKLRVIEFSTLTFLKELNRNKIRKIKIRQWLLLALRTLLIVLIILAFSRPALQGTFGSAGSRAASTLVILFDNSASMQLHNGKGSFLLQGQRRAEEIISTMQEQDELYFLRLSDVPQATTEEPIRDARAGLSLIRDTEISTRFRTIDDGMRLASRLFQQSKNFNKELFIITDGQSASLAADDRKTVEPEKLFPPDIKVFYSSLSDRQAENTSIEHAFVPPTLLQTGKPFTLNVLVKNHGTVTIQNRLVTVTLNGTKVMQKSVSLNAGENKTIDFLLTPYRSGFLSGYAELEDDGFEQDNRYYFTMVIPASMNISLVSPEERYARYIQTALNTARDMNTASPVNITTIAPAQITTTVLSNSDVLIFSGVKELPQSQAEIVRRYLLNGGSILFFPSADSAVAPYHYMSQLGVNSLSIFRSRLTFDKVDLQFPIFRGMFEKQLQDSKTKVESPEIFSSLNAASDIGLRSIITMSNGKPFLWQRLIGSGTLLGVAVPATEDWSDFPLKGFFVPFLYQSALYLASPVNAGGEQKYWAGERLEFSSDIMKKKSNSAHSALWLFDPERRNVPMTLYGRTTSEGISKTMFSVEQADFPGIYFGVDKSDTLLALALNTRREESATTLSGPSDVEALANRVGISPASLTPLNSESDLVQTISESRFGIELWKYFLLAAAFVALIEMVIAREPKQYVSSV